MVNVGNNDQLIAALEQHPNRQFHMKDLGCLKYFLGLEVERTEKGIFVCQRKYILDFLEETGMGACEPLRLPLNQNIKLLADIRQPLPDPSRYRRMIGKLIYLTVTRSDIIYSVQMLSQFMNKPTIEHLKPVTHVLRYLKHTPGQGIFFAKDSDTHMYAYCDYD